jgi:hypothetical protein
MVFPALQLSVALVELRLQSIAAGLPMEKEFALPRLAADEGEPEEVEGFRLT